MKIEAYKRQLSVNGFIIIDLLNNEEVKYLNALSEKHLTAAAADFIASSHFLSAADSQMINHELHKVVKPKVDLMFPELMLLGGTLATKFKGSSVLKAHNDWTIVEESKFHSYNLWIPLLDTEKKNGTLGVIPSSHRWAIQLRGLNIPGYYEQYTSKLINIGYEPALKAGQAMLYDHRLIHYSRPNTTEYPRNVAILGMKDKEAPLRVSFSLNNQTIETYNVEQDDFYGFDAQKIASSKEKVFSIPLDTKTLKWQDILQQFNEHVSDEFTHLVPKRKSFFSKLLDKF